MLAATIIIESETEQRLKRTCQKNQIVRNFLKENNGKNISEIKGRLYVPKVLK